MGEPDVLAGGKFKLSESMLMGYEGTSALLDGVLVNTLKDWRAKGKGPRSAVIGGKVKYRRDDVLDWIDEQFDKTARGSRVATPFEPLGKRSLASV